MLSLARRVEKDGFVDASCIGKGVRELSQDSKAWEDRGTYAEGLQELKLLWHVLVKYGK
jgi:phage-related protein